MIKVNTLEEYQALMCFKNYCLNTQDCRDCFMLKVCKHTSVELRNLDFEFVADNPSENLDKETKDEV